MSPRWGCRSFYSYRPGVGAVSLPTGVAATASPEVEAGTATEDEAIGSATEAEAIGTATEVDSGTATAPEVEAGMATARVRGREMVEKRAMWRNWKRMLSFFFLRRLFDI